MEINEPESILPTSSKSLLSSEEEDSSSKKSARNVRKKIFIDPSLEVGFLSKTP